MGHFLGTHQSRLDAKGRVSVPAAFRAALRDGGTGDAEPGAMILRPSHQHPCIEAWPAAAFHALAAPLAQYDVFSDTQDDLATALYSDALELVTDKEGRIVLPQALLEHAGISDALEFMGIGRIFQIWHPETARQRREQARASAQSKRLTLPGTARPSAGEPA